MYALYALHSSCHGAGATTVPCAAYQNEQHALTATSLTSSYVNDALQGVLHPLIQVVLLA